MISNWENWLLESTSSASASAHLYNTKLHSLSSLMKIPDFIKTGLEIEMIDSTSTLVDIDIEKRTEIFLQDCRLISRELKTPTKDLYVLFFDWPFKYGVKMTFSRDPLIVNSRKIEMKGNHYDFWYDIIGDGPILNYPTRDIEGVRKNSDYVKLNINPQLHFVIYELTGTGVDEKVLIMKKDTIEILQLLSNFPIDKAKELISTKFKKPVDIENLKHDYRGIILGNKFGL
jgi:hypothetical protein